MTAETKRAATWTLAIAGNTMLLIQLMLDAGAIPVLAGYAVFCLVAFPLVRGAARTVDPRGS